MISVDSCCKCNLAPVNVAFSEKVAIGAILEVFSAKGTFMTERAAHEASARVVGVDVCESRVRTYWSPVEPVL